MYICTYILNADKLMPKTNLKPPEKLLSKHDSGDILNSANQISQSTAQPFEIDPIFYTGSLFSLS